VQVTLRYAEQHLAELADAVDNGQEVEIARSDKPTLKLVVSQTPPAKRTTPRILGAGRGEMIVPNWEHWKATDREMVREL
jgi:antitoxin (DNA-binding transcriptional repressor) of toxin-antitoxin stability system